MNLHEYQGKQLFADYGLPVSNNKVIHRAEDAVDAPEAVAEEATEGSEGPTSRFAAAEEPATV